MIYLAFNKPYGILSQFTNKDGNESLNKFFFPKNIYPAGRLDYDSEGLLILTDDGIFNQKITNPKFKKEKTYFAQVDRIITIEAIKKLKEGIILNDGPAKALDSKIINAPILPPRIVPIRERKNVPTSWVEIKITEGRNRQVRRMLANVGFPVLRLVRYSIGKVNIDNLKQGEFRNLSEEEIKSF